MSRLFGTDGIRGVAGVWPLDPPTVARLGAAIVRGLHSHRAPRLIIGRDTRESGEWIERELARGAASQGAVVSSAGIMPTPGVAYLARSLDFDLGVVISASHNPYQDNGIKVFSGPRRKVWRTRGARRRSDGGRRGLASRRLAGRHAAIERGFRRTVLWTCAANSSRSAGPLTGARLAIDMANGATTATAARVLTRSDSNS